MAATQDEIDARLTRLERDLRELSTAVTSSRPTREGRKDVAMQGISLASWLQLTGPTFATLVLGFTLLWNAQQATTGSLLEVQRSVGRLEGSIGALDARIEHLDARIESLDSRIQSLDVRLQGLDTRLEQLADAVNTLAKRLGPS